MVTSDAPRRPGGHASRGPGNGEKDLPEGCRLKAGKAGPRRTGGNPKVNPETG